MGHPQLNRISKSNMNLDAVNEVTLRRILSTPEGIAYALRASMLTDDPIEKFNAIKKACEKFGLDFNAGVLEAFEIDKKVFQALSDKSTPCDGGTFLTYPFTYAKETP